MQYLLIFFPKASLQLCFKRGEKAIVLPANYKAAVHLSNEFMQF